MCDCFTVCRLSHLELSCHNRGPALYFGAPLNTKRVKQRQLQSVTEAAVPSLHFMQAISRLTYYSSLQTGRACTCLYLSWISRQIQAGPLSSGLQSLLPGPDPEEASKALVNLSLTHSRGAQVLWCPDQKQSEYDNEKNNFCLLVLKQHRLNNELHT